MGKRLRSLRGDLTQQKVASDLSITVYQLSRYENGKSKPTPEMLVQFSDYYGVTVDYIVGKSDDPRLTEDGQKRVYAELEELMKMIKNLSEEDKKRVTQRLLDFTKGAIGDKK